MQVFKMADNEYEDNTENMILNKLRVCITKKSDFLSPYSYTFRDVDPVTNRAIGRYYKARKYLTEETNRSLTEENVVETRLYLDYLILLSKFNRKVHEDSTVSFDEQTSKSISKKHPIPKEGDRLILVSQNTHESDTFSTKLFSCVVVKVFPFIVKMNREGNYYQTSFSNSMGSIEVEIDFSTYTPKRSLVLPPLIPKRVIPNFSIV